MSADKPGTPSCQALANILPEPFVIIDREYNIVATNDAYRRHYRVEGETVVGRHCYEVSHNSSVPCSQNGEHCPLEEVLRSGDTSQVIHVHHCTDHGSERVQLQAVPIRDERGEIRFIGEYIHPLTERAADQSILVGRSRVLMQLQGLLERVAPTRTTVLLQGESGVGKERAAEYIHHCSTRAEGPFVVVDCGTLGESLIESELFGHEKGAFTGAVQRKHGLFEAADGGTLFIDELGELPMALQTKLLRVLETGSIRRLGGTDYIPVDVRVVAATNRNLQEMVERGEFRGDLYYRLSAFPVHVPPLRVRRDDIPVLAEQFLRELEGDGRLPLSPAVIDALVKRDYPGNVRELRNVIERAAILAGERRIEPQDVACEAGDCMLPDESGVQDPVKDPFASAARRARLDARTIAEALQRCGGHRARAAQRLGVSERTLYRHLARVRG